MIPGRSLSAKTRGRSWAPVASTTRPALMFQRRWRLVPAGALGPRWSVRRSSALSELWS